MKNNKGITLIALIITIIVMLILVAVTVAVVVNSNLIGTAQGAKTNTEAAYAEESNMSGFNVIINGEERYFSNTEEYVDYLTGNEETTLAAGLYETGTTTLKTSWSDLKTQGILVVDSSGYLTVSHDATMLGENPDVLAGDLIIDEEVTSLYIHRVECTSITIPKYVTSPEFTSCVKTTKFIFAPGSTVVNLNWDGFLPKEISLPSTITNIENMSFNEGRNSEPVLIYFDGTITQWKAITKADGWNGMAYYLIRCTDGDLTVDSSGQ